MPVQNLLIDYGCIRDANDCLVQHLSKILVTIVCDRVNDLEKTIS